MPNSYYTHLFQQNSQIKQLINSPILHPKSLVLALLITFLISTNTVTIPNYDLSSAQLDPTKTGYSVAGTFGRLLGYSVSTAGDIDNDGYSDVLIGSYATSTFKGIIIVLYGGPESTFASFTLPTTLDPLTIGFKITGVAMYDYFGTSASTAGDVNNDGYSDIIVGADAGNRGAAYVVYGGPRTSLRNIDLSTTSLVPLTTGFKIAGNANDYLGKSVSSAGDINNDNYDDVVIGTSGTGMVYVIYGGPKASLPNLDFSVVTLNPLVNGFTIAGNTVPGGIGRFVSSAGDINNDNYDDIIIGAYGKNGNQGAAYIIYGGPKSSMSSFSLNTTPLNPLTTGFIITGNAANDYFGRSVSSAGDINNDNYDDIIIGAYGKNGYQGAAYVIYGGPKTSLPNIDLSTTALNPLSNGFMMTGDSANDYFGYTASSAGDLNNDNYDDIIIGAYQRNGSQGAAYVIYGGPKTSLPNLAFNSMTLDPATTGFTILGGAQGDRFGCSVGTAGDVNNDGYDDIIIGAWYVSPALGAAYIVHSTCPVAHCSSCLSRVCQACKIKYYLTSSAQCAVCPNNCDQCSDSSICTVCTTPYLLYQSQCISNCNGARYISGAQCLDCSSHCSLCTSLASCQTCDVKYYLTASAQCSGCPNSCDQCSDSSTCTVCTTPYLLYQSQCISNCNGARFVSGGQCLDCSSHCSSCTSLASCQACDIKYYLTSSAQCSACPSNCDQCSDSSTCTLCTPSHLLYQSHCVSFCTGARFVSGGQCLDCSSHCSSCTSLSSCQACDTKYYLTSSAQCFACPNNCDQCSDSSTCTLCAASYLLHQSQCCPPATFFSTSNSQCQDCPLHCSSCTSKRSCQACDPGYILIDFSCILPPSLPPALKTQAKVSHAIASSASGLGSLLCFGSSTFPVNTLISKTVQNTRYMNLTVTEKLAEAYKTWGTQLIEWDLPDVFSRLENDFRPQPYVFERYSLDSPFLVNFWSSLMTVTVGIGALLIFSLTKRLFVQKSGWIHSLLDKLAIGSINFTIAQAYGCFDDILFYSVLDLRSNPFNSFFAWASFFVALGFIVIGILHILFNIMMVKHYQKVKTECIAAGNNMSDLETFNIRNKYWEVFYSDFSDADSWSHCFLALLIVRNSVSSLIIATLYASRVTQATCLLMIDGAIIVFVISKSPFLTVRAAVAQYFYEAITLMVHLCVFILCVQGNDKVKNAVCNLIIYLNICLIAGGTCFMLFEVFKTVKAIFKTWKAKNAKKSAVSPAPLETSDAQNILTATQPIQTEQDFPACDLPPMFQSGAVYLAQGYNINPIERTSIHQDFHQSLSDNTFSYLPENNSSHWLTQQNDQSIISLRLQNRSRLRNSGKWQNRPPIGIRMSME